jgi:hypothetical protein
MKREMHTWLNEHQCRKDGSFNWHKTKAIQTTREAEHEVKKVFSQNETGFQFITCRYYMARISIAQVHAVLVTVDERRVHHTCCLKDKEMTLKETHRNELSIRMAALT